MSVRLASISILISLCLLAGCAAQQTDVRNFTSSQWVSGSTDDGNRSLTGAQLSALSNWTKTGNDWSGFSADIPDNPIMEVDMKEANGEGDKLMVYQLRDGSITAYLYHGQRLVPLRRRLSDTDFATLKSILSGQ
jgi:hypothetical protein